MEQNIQESSSSINLSMKAFGPFRTAIPLKENIFRLRFLMNPNKYIVLFIFRAINNLIFNLNG